MDKGDIVGVLKEMGDLLEIEEANAFEIMAFRNGMRSVDDFGGEIQEAVEAGTLTEIDGIGKGLARVITQLVREGRSEDHESLKGRFPSGLPALLGLRGIGPKKVKALWKGLGVTSLEALEAAARSQRVRTLRGFGAKTEEGILSSIEWRRGRDRKLAPSTRARTSRLRVTTMAAAGTGRLYAGTSGYAYKEWKGTFYPEKLAATKFLSHYAGRLPTVEVNNSFYRFPTEANLQAWADQTPPDFLFAVKANRRITHRLRLKGVEEVTASFVERCGTLGARLGPILFQLPPNLARDDALLEAFLACLPAGGRYALEFRHPTWVDDAVFARLSDAGVALVVHDGETLEMPREATADFVYVRLRRPSYDDARLESWNAWFDGLARGRRDVFVYLKHKAHASPEDVLGRWIAAAAPARALAPSARRAQARDRRKA